MRSSAAPPVASVARQLVKLGARNAIVLDVDRGRSFVGAAGKQRPSATTRFRIASVTKTFTAVLVLQLVAEKKLRLDETLERFLPGVVPAGRKITIRDLLRHQSGLSDAGSDAAYAKADHSPTFRPIDALRYEGSRPLLFQPGTQWGYSNTNYLALGLIVEKVTGHTYADELSKRILRPLELNATTVATTRRPVGAQGDPGVNPKLLFGSGSIVSNAYDLARFFGALLAGRLVPKPLLAQMKHAIPIADPDWSGDGLGLFESSLPCGHFWGHRGWLFDYQTLVEASPNGKQVAVIAYRSPDPRLIDTLSLLCH
jgi:D-alanyl-D-alanine carboxypeptidase